MSSYDRFTGQGKKASLADMLSAEDSALHNSNMLNIVSAIKKANNAIAEYEHKLKFWKEQKAKLEEFGEKGDMQDTQTVHDLFNAKPEPFKARNW